MIPKIIHYIWLGGIKTDKVKRCIASWDILLRDGWDIMEWSESNLNLDEAPPLIKKYIKKKKWAYAADYFRLKILMENPGMYLDTDMYMIKIIPPFLLYKSFFAGLESTDLVATGVIGCDGSPKIKELLKMIMSYYESNQKIEMSPKIFTPAVHKFFDYYNPFKREIIYELRYNSTILSSEYFYPLHWTTGKLNKYRPTLSNHTIGIHEWTGSALGNDPLSKTFESNYREIINNFIKENSNDLSNFNS